MSVPESPGALGRLRARYIDLLKRSILGKTNEDNELRIWYLRRALTQKGRYHPMRVYTIRGYAPPLSEDFLRHMENGVPFGGDVENLPFTYTMVGRPRLENVEQCVLTILDDGIPGDFIECGVWRGGVVMLMRGILAAYEVTDRRVWAADSFEGLPRISTPQDKAWPPLNKFRHRSLAVDLETVKRGLESHDLLDDQVEFLPGWFSETLPAAPIERLALLRLDGDMYGSTMDALHALYDKVVPGGFIVVDDYALPPCKQAVEDFRASRSVTDAIHTVDWTGVYWRKS